MKIWKLFAVFTIILVLAGCFNWGNHPDPLSGDDNIGEIAISCLDGAAVIGCSLAARYTGYRYVEYQWHRDGIALSNRYQIITADKIGTYTVTISAKGFKSKTSAPVVVGPIPDLKGDVIISPSENVTTGTEISVSYSGSEAVTYQWEKDGVVIKNKIVIGLYEEEFIVSFQTYRPLQPGIYTATVSAAGYKNKTSAPVIVTGNTLKAVNIVSFDSDGGSNVAKQEVKYNETADITRTGSNRIGYILEYWYNAAEGDVEYDFDTPVTADITLKAKWAVKNYTVTFIDENGIEKESQIVGRGALAVRPPDPPARTGYNCVYGWYKSDNSSYIFDFPVNNDIILYAKWGPYPLGSTGPGGGSIFYRKESGFTMRGKTGTFYYMEAVSSGNSTYAWGDRDTNVGGTGTSFGDGWNNTQLIRSASSVYSAADACASTKNGFSDWFLPSKDELNLIYQNKQYVNNITNNVYWSSSQVNTTTAWYQGFSGSGGQNYSVGKQEKYSVCAVRAF